MSVLHVMYEGQSWDLTFSELDIGDQSSDQDVKQAVAFRLNAPLEKLRNFKIDRNSDGNMTLRPEAVFGEK